MTTFLVSCLLLISGCAYLIRGGSQKLFHGPLPGDRWIGAALTTASFAAWLFYNGLADRLNLVLSVIFAAGWIFTILWAWQPYYSIGSSNGVRRHGFPPIDWLLDKIWGTYQYSVTGNITTVINSRAWLVSREFVGMFLRMLLSFPLFLGIGLVFDPHWYVGLLALQYSAAFAFVTVLIYAAWNWLLPSSFHGDDKLNWSELLTGIAIMGFTLQYLDVLL